MVSEHTFGAGIVVVFQKSNCDDLFRCQIKVDRNRLLPFRYSIDANQWWEKDFSKKIADDCVELCEVLA